MTAWICTKHLDFEYAGSYNRFTNLEPVGFLQKGVNL